MRFVAKSRFDSTNMNAILKSESIFSGQPPCFIMLRAMRWRVVAVIAALANWKMDCGGNHRRSDVRRADRMSLDRELTPK